MRILPFVAVLVAYYWSGVTREFRGVSGGSGERCGAEFALKRRKRTLRVDIDLGKIVEENWPSFTAVSFHDLACRGSSFAIGAQELAYP